MEQQEIVNEITQVLVEKVSQYLEVSIILMYGSRAKGTQSPKSDVEFITILDNYKKIHFEFIYKDLPVDMWSTSWAWLEKMAKREEYFLLPAGSYVTGKVVYSRSKKDQKRFESLIESIEDFKSYKHIHYDKAVDHWRRMKTHLGDLLIAQKHEDLGEARTAANNILIGATIVLGHLNQKYYTNNWGVALYETLQFEILPADFHQDITILSTSGDIAELLETSTQLIDNIRQLLIDHLTGRDDREIKGPDVLKPENTNGLSYLNKIRKAVVKGDIFGLSYAVHDFQLPLMHDVQIIQGKWDKASRLRLYSEILDDYLKTGYPDFTPLITSNNETKILQTVDNLEKVLDNMQPDHIKFDNFEKLQNYVSRSQFELE